MDTIRIIVLLTLCSLGFLNSIDGRRPFEIFMDSLNCTTSPKYVKEFNCGIDRTQKPPKGYLMMQMIRSVKTMRFSFELKAFKSNSETLSLFNTTDSDGCFFMEKIPDETLLKIYRDVLAKAGKMPSCPTPANYRFDFKNMIIDAEKFPPYVPDSKFGLLISAFADNKQFLFWVEVIGKVVQKQKSKGKWSG